MSNATTAARREAYLAAVRAGMTRQGAAGAAGVSRQSAWAWLQDEAFADRVAEAESAFERRLIRRVEIAANKGSWRAALALLERRFADRWMRREGLEVTGELDGLFGLGEITRRDVIAIERDREMRDKSSAELDAEIWRLLEEGLSEAPVDSGG